MGQLAEEFVQAVATGDGEAHWLGVELAHAVAEEREPVNRLVAAIWAGGPFMIRRALELAHVVLAERRDSQATWAPKPKAGAQ